MTTAHEPQLPNELGSLVALDDPQAIADAAARACAKVARYRGALLSLGLESGPIVGTHGLTEAEEAHFRASAARGSRAERERNRVRLRSLAFEGTGIVHVRRTPSWNIVPTPQERFGPTAGWTPEDTVYVLVPGADGRDIGVLSLDMPLDGLVPTAGTLGPLRRVERMLAAIGPLIESRAYLRRLRETERMLWQAQRLDLVWQVASEVAHDFNNVLAIILAQADLGMEQSPPEMREVLREIVETAERGTAIARRVLGVARRGVAGERPRDLSVFVASASDALGRLLPTTIRLRVEPAAEPLPIVAEETDLLQILLNLVVNARDAVGEHGTIAVSTAAHVDNGTPFAVLTVTDDGAGMDEATRERAFEPFFTTKGGGTGLGLATVHGIVTRLRGRVAVASAPGHGTTVRVELPVRPPAR